MFFFFFFFSFWESFIRGEGVHFLFDIEDLGKKEKEAADVVVRLLLDALKIPSSSRAMMAEP